MKRLILILMGFWFVLMLRAQLPAQETYRFYKLAHDTINILPSDNVYKLSIYVDDASTDSCEITCTADTLDNIAKDTILLAPGLNFVIGNEQARRLDTLYIVARDGCIVWITTLE